MPLPRNGLLLSLTLLVLTVLPLACTSKTPAPRTQPSPTKTAETVLSDGIVDTIAGTGNVTLSSSALGVPLDPLREDVGTPWDVKVDRKGIIWFSSFLDSFYKLTPDGALVKIINNKSVIGSVPVVDTSKPGMSGRMMPTVFDFLPPNDDLILPDMMQQRVYRIPRSGDDYDLTRGTVMDFGDIKVERPSVVHVFRGKIYVASSDNTQNGPGASYIVEHDPTTGKSRIAAGNGQPGYTGDGGPATQAKINPIDLDIHSDGLMLIADNSSTLRVVNLNASGTLEIFGTKVPAGTIATIAGKNSDRYADEELVGIKDDPLTGGNFLSYAYRYARISLNTGDEGPATEAKIDWPFGPRFDSEGRVHFVDSDNHRIRIIDKFGIIHTVAGNSVPEDNGQRMIGAPGGFNAPIGMSGRGASGDYCRQNFCQTYPRLFSYAPSPTEKCACFTQSIGDGKPGLQANLYHPMSLTVIERGNNTFDYLVPDTDNSRLRKLTGVRLSG